MPSPVFLDRDGVICRRRPGDYVRRWAEFEFLPRAPEALALLTAHGYLTIVVTNQRGIARGLMTEEDLAEIHQRMCSALAAAGARLDAIYHCPHEAGTCRCRKPGTGLFEQARADFPGLDFAGGYMIGDSPSDMEAGRRLRLRTILVRGSGNHGEEVPGRAGVFRQVPSLYAAVTEVIMPQRNGGSRVGSDEKEEDM